MLIRKQRIYAFTKRLCTSKDSLVKRDKRLIRTQRQQTASRIEVDHESIRESTGLKGSLDIKKIAELYAANAYFNSVEENLISGLKQDENEFDSTLNQTKTDIKRLNKLHGREKLKLKKEKAKKKKEAQNLGSFPSLTASDTVKDTPLDVPESRERKAVHREKDQSGEIKRDIMSDHHGGNADHRGDKFVSEYFEDKSATDVKALPGVTLNSTGAEDEENLTPNYGPKMLLFIALILGVVSLAEITGVLRNVQEAYKVPNESLWKFLGLPLAVSSCVMFFFKKDIREWLKGSVRSSWKHLPVAFYLMFVFMLGYSVSLSIVSYDNERIDNELRRQRQEQPKAKKGYRTAKERAEAPVLKFPERKYEWALVSLYVFQGLFLPFMVGVLHVVFMFTFRAYLLERKIKRNIKKLLVIQQRHEKRRRALKTLRPTARIIIRNLGRLGYYEEMISNPLTESEIQKIIDSKNHSGKSSEL